MVRALCGKAPIVFGDGTQTRDFTHVYDTAAALARAGVKAGVIGETINVGNGSEVSVRDLARIVVDVTAPFARPGLADRPSGGGSPIEHIEARPGDVLRLFADSSKAQRLLDHHPVVTLAAGLADLAQRLHELGGARLRELDAGIVIRNWA